MEETKKIRWSQGGVDVASVMLADVVAVVVLVPVVVVAMVVRVRWWWLLWWLG